MSLQTELKEQEVNNLIEINYALCDLIGQLENKIEKIRKKISNNKDEIYKICNHEWKYELISYEPCGNRWEQCTKCHLYK